MYSIETYKADKAALDCAKSQLSKLVAGEGDGLPSLYHGEYSRISAYFGRKDAISGITSYGDAVRRVARMFMVISTARSITGFDCNVYAAILEQVEKKIKSMRTFKRRAKIMCFAPRDHKQPCFCARLQAVEAAASIANSPVSNDLKEELQAKVSGALILDKEFENENTSLRG
jgi:hypothetical protein